MKASVIEMEDGNVKVLIRYGGIGTLYKRHHDLKIGDVIEVKRQTNNPYLLRVEDVKWFQDEKYTRVQGEIECIPNYPGPHNRF